MSGSRKYKIIWAGPWNIKSAIADFSLQIAEELKSKGHEVLVFRTETDEAMDIKPIDNKNFEVHFWKKEKILKTRHDIIINNFGNYYRFHGAVLDDLNEFNMLGILHDSFYCNLIAEWADKKHKAGIISAEEFLKNILKNTYGSNAYEKFNQGGDFRFWRDLEIMAQEYPLVEFLAYNLSGAVCHSEHYLQRVKAACPGPVEKIPLCMKFDDLPENTMKNADGNILTVAVIGHGNPNKRLEQILHAVGSDSLLKEKFRFKLIGQIEDDYKEKLENIAGKLNLHKAEFTGWVSDADLRKNLAEADVLCCLREPILEGGSASLIFAMQSGRPVLVLNHGSYAELPDDCVFKCSLDNETADIKKYLKWIYENLENAYATGNKAKEFSINRNSAEFYADKLIPLIDEVILSEPVISAAKSIGRTLSGFGLDAGDPALERIGKIMDELFNIY